MGTLVLAAVLLLEGGCSFNTYDSSRPFVREWLPDRQERAALAELMAAEKEEKKAIRKSLTGTKRALATFSVSKYGEKFSYYRIRELIEALELFPDNPYAWIGLGAYLGISFQPSQAATATRIGVERMQHHLSAESAFLPVMEPALRDGLLNLANFSLQADDLEMARRALDQLEEFENLDVLHRLALTRLKLLTQLRWGNLEGAQNALDELETAELELGDNPVDFSIWYDYPRFRTTEERRETNDWLHAQILLAQAHYEDAISILENSIRREENTSSKALIQIELDDSELWEAHLSLAKAYFQRAEEAGDEQRQADLAEARRVLQDVLDAIPSREFIPEEYVAFNLGNVLFAQGEYEEAIKSYKKAVRDFNRSFTDLREAWIRFVVDDEVASFDQLLPEDPAVPTSTSTVLRVASEKWDLDGIILEILSSEEATAHAMRGGTELEPDDTAPLYLQLLRNGLEASYVAIRSDSPYYRLILELDFQPKVAGQYIYGDAYNNLGNAYFELGRSSTGKARSDAWQGARRSYRLALWDNRYETPEVPYVGLARIALEEGRTTEAYRDLTHALSINPLLRTAMDLLLVAAQSATDSEEAAGGLYLLVDHVEQIAGPGGIDRGWSQDILQEVEELLGTLGPSEEKQAVEARLLALRGDDHGALLAYRKMSQAESTSIWPWAGLVRAAEGGAKLMWLKRGVHLAQNRQQLSPWALVDYRYLLHQRGEQYLENGQLCSALKDFDTALKVSPGWQLAEQGRDFARMALRREGQVCP